MSSHGGPCEPGEMTWLGRPENNGDSGVSVLSRMIGARAFLRCSAVEGER